MSMTWCNDSNETTTTSSSLQIISSPSISNVLPKSDPCGAALICPSCGHTIEFQDQGGIIQDLPGLPAGVKFDPTDQEILEHLEARVTLDSHKIHPLIDEFIPTLEGENGICYTHPEKLPGVSKDGQIRHFFHRPSKAYTTGTRKRRKVHTDEDGSCGETRWHKTGKTKPVLINSQVKGFKKILVLYTNYGRQRKPEKTNWVMHQYHLGDNEEEKDGELVVSKVFYQTQPRQCGNSVSIKDSSLGDHVKVEEDVFTNKETTAALIEYYQQHPSFIGSYNEGSTNHSTESSHDHLHQLIPNLVVQGDAFSNPFIRQTTANAAGKRKL